MVERRCLGIDIGGTKIAAGLVDSDGRLLQRRQVGTPARAGADAIIRAAVTVGREVIGNAPVAAVGVGAAGVILDGVVTSATELLAGWTGTDLARSVKAAFDQLPVVAINDVHAHGVGEAWRGSGAGYRSVLVVAVGTGLGGVVVQDGQPMTGAHGAAGHLGHIPSPDAADLSCSCGEIGHLEAVASGYGLLRLYHRLGGDRAIADARAVSAAAGHDQHAAEALRRSGTALGRALGGLINTIDPEQVIISGSLSRAGDPWWQSVRAAAGASCLPILSSIPIVPAALGDDAGVIGAARLAHGVAGRRP